MPTADDDNRDLPPGLALAWGLQAPAHRGPKPGLTLDGIVAAAIELADSGGLAAASMSRVAEALGFTTMSLYRYVRSKDDLVMLMGDAAVGEPPPTLDPGPSWREGTDNWARAILDVYRRHLWIFDVPLSAPPAMPNQLLWLDRALQALTDTGLSNQEQLSSALLVDGYVRNWVQLSKGIIEASGTGFGAADGSPSHSTILGTLVDAARYPALAPMIVAGEFDDDGDDDLDELFTFGLDRILDGIDALIRTRSRRRSRR